MLVFCNYSQVEVQLEILVFSNRLKFYGQNVRLCKCDLSLRIANTVFLLESSVKKATCDFFYFFYIMYLSMDNKVLPVCI